MERKIADIIPNLVDIDSFFLYESPNVTLNEEPVVTKLPFKDFSLASKGVYEGHLKLWEPTGFDNITCSGNDHP